MTFVRRFALLLTLASLSPACQPKDEVQAEPKKAAKKPAGKSEKGEHKADPKGEHKGEHKAEAEPVDPGKFAVPFAWEAAKDEPLALTRQFMNEAITDNQDYMEHGDKYFAAFADKQTPRATVLTCADSRVHSTAWDVTPENDDFMIRNIGNQVENAPGSVEYGVEHLHTPLLLIIGHTGCGAVKAAMGDMSKLSPEIQKELEHIHPPKAAAGKSPETAWAEAVVANVNDQVGVALRHFGKNVQTGELTVVGAVYDFRNDLQRGAGKLSIVNVNGNSEAERMEAFVEAVGGKKVEAKDPKKRGKGKFDDKAAAAAIAEQLAKLRHGGGAEVQAPVEPKAEHAAEHSGH
jgi:carbonic anhydrase